MRGFERCGALLLLACSSTTEPFERVPAGPIAPVDGGRCEAMIEEHPITGQTHRAECSPLDFATNPPCEGDHYGRWAAHGIYEVPLPRGFWVHNLEHGAVVFSYNCDDCAEEIEAARAAVTQAPDDPACGAPRLILTPDPLLDVGWAASAWGFTLRASCFEPEVFTAFYADRRGHGAEAVCSSGIELRNADGTLALPAGCGESSLP
jgi:hypothetical protein